MIQGLNPQNNNNTAVNFARIGLNSTSCKIRLINDDTVQHYEQDR